MNLSKFFKRYFAASNNRLICHYNSKIAGFIDFTNCFSNTINQFKVIYISKEPNIFIDRSIPVKEDCFLLVFQIFSRDSAFLAIFTNGIVAFRCSHVFDIFWAVIAEHLSRSSQWF